MSKSKVKLIGIVIALSSILLGAANINTAASLQSTEAIDDFVNKQMDIANIPGLSLGIVKDDQIVYLKGYGIADETKRPVTPQTPFMIGSITKSFTALAIRQLVNEGKIELDRPVIDYIPWFKLSDVKASRQITIRNLEEHTSGISTQASYEYELYNDRYSLVQAVQMLARVKPNKPVGQSFQYSNINYIILGLVVQTVSGMTYEEYIKNNIFDPLQMKNSFCAESDALNHGMAKGYQLYFGLLMPRHVPYSKALLPAANLIMSSEDMAHYMIAFLNNGKYNDSNITMESNGLNNADQTADNGLNYNLNWNPFRWYPSDGYPEYAGGYFNNSSDMLFIPEGKWGVIVLANTNSGTLANTTIGPISIANGIAKQFLVPQKYQPATNDINKVYFVLDFIILLILLLLAVQIRNFIKKRDIFLRSRISLVKFLVELILINFVFPLGILFGFPRLFNDQNPSWAFVKLALPDIAYFCIISSGLFLAMGIIKAIHLLVFMRTFRYQVKHRGNETKTG
ncbi:MAG TPA: serine hydrolase domain-containing protein [Ruminiclostridium sp.]|nr:serine hydrolase domain-containing protein [Ruminiclostridium sp.]